MTPADVEDLAARFAVQAIPHREWTHREHLVVATWHIHHCGAEEALARLRAGIRALNDAHGTPNSASRGYHETITRAYVALVAELLADCPAEMPLDARVERVLAGPLAATDVLLRFYSRDRLLSSEARAEWLAPDLAPLRYPFTRD